MPDSAELMQRLRPHADADFDPDGARAQQALDAIVRASPAPVPRRRRTRQVRRLAPLVAGLAVAAVLGAGLTASPSGGPDVLANVASAAESFAQPGGIYHFRVQRSNAGGVVDVREIWHSADGRRKRILFASGLETVLDYERRFSGSYNPEEDAIFQQVYAGQFDGPPPELDSPVVMSTENISGLARMLDRARSDEGDVKLVGEATIRGIPAYELRYAFDFAGSSIDRTIFVDRERYLPLRVVEGAIVDDFLQIERLPATPANLRQLEMTPHPGARLIVERF